MAVKKKLAQSIDRFIDNGAAVKASKNKRFKNVLIRIPVDILDDLDLFLEKKPWLNRTQLIISIIHEQLKNDIEV